MAWVLEMTKAIKLFHIYYDEKSKSELRPGFELLDNTTGPSEFREIVPIFNYLKEQTIRDDEWLGFFSPKFFEKTGLEAKDVLNQVCVANGDTDAFLFTAAWWHIAYYKNVWEHGEYFHPGIAEICQKLATRAGYDIDLLNSVSTLDTAVFSHFLVAKGSFWKEWQRVVKLYFEMIVEDDAAFMKTVEYGDIAHFSVHPFVIERVPSMILQNKPFKGLRSNEILRRGSSDIESILNPNSEFGNSMIGRYSELLIKADTCKAKFLETGQQDYLDEYWRFRFWSPTFRGHQNLTKPAIEYLQARKVHASYDKLTRMAPEEIDQRRTA